MDIVESIDKLKPKSIFDVVERDFFLEYEDRNGSSAGHDYLHCNDYYELYYDISKFYQPETIFEIGVRYGYSLYSLIKGSDKVNYVLGYDIDEEIYNNKEWISKKLNLDSNNISSVSIAKSRLEKFCEGVDVNIEKENSQEITELDDYMDLIHIDGDHTYEGKVHDLEITKQKGKVIVIDDYSHIREVKMATDNFIKSNKSIIKNHYLLSSFRGTYIIEY